MALNGTYSNNIQEKEINSLDFGGSSGRYIMIIKIEDSVC
jgi:hypothetical protein